jgi:hypothetical protein
MKNRIEKGDVMDLQLGDVIKMKKAHPCGANQWKILRTGIDFRLECMGCGRQVMVTRKLVEKNFRGKIE